MGKHFNAELYRQFDRTMDKGLDESMGDETPLTPEQIEQIEVDKQDRLREDRLYAIRQYARPVCRVSLFDEGGVGR